MQKILVVDDHVESAQGLAELLRLWRHEAHVVHDGSAAIEAAHRLGPTVVLLDLGLPGMDGCAVARRMREDGMADVLLVALTGSGSPDDRRRAADAGFDHHLVKPVDLSRLEQLLDAR